jgi:phage terminase large subunit-like protein
MVLEELTADELELLAYDWRTWARPKQLPSQDDFTIWLIQTGRGWGKTRTGAEWVRDRVERHAARRVALVGRTAPDARDVMVEGASGILAVSPPWNRPQYEPSKRRVTWPNGAVATLYSADTPDLLRGPEHDTAWADEVAAWPHVEAWDNLMMGLRVGRRPQAVVTTTPKPRRIIREIRERADTLITTGHTEENLANLAPAFLTTVVAKYEGTRTGRQELGGELLEDAEGALWTRSLIEASRRDRHPDLVRIVVAIDPAAKSREDSNETGIVAAGVGVDGHGYVLSDASGRRPPIKSDADGREGWANVAVNLYRSLAADRIVAETNNGGEMVEATIRVVDPSAAYREVIASRGKTRRAEPIAAFYEQGRVHHVGSFSDLEDQMCTYVPTMSETHSESPDRMDALVWALTELLITPTLFVV